MKDIVCQKPLYDSHSYKGNNFLCLSVPTNFLRRIFSLEAGNSEFALWRYSSKCTYKEHQKDNDFHFAFQSYVVLVVERTVILMTVRVASSMKTKTVS